MIPTINPWKGLQPYLDSEDDLKLHPFCGRENVVREMFDLIDNNIITTLYGKSGIGKTSLLNAGLFPKLRLEDYIPVYVRLGTDCLENETFAECIIRKIVEKTAGLDSRVGIEMAMPDCSKADFLWAFFAKYDFYTKDNSVRYPVVILDQFEEIFNSNPESVKQILLQLQELTSDKLLPDGSPFDVNFRVAISIREDDLCLLEDAIDSYYISELKFNRYRLKPLSKKEAIRVIEVRDYRNVALCKDLFDEDQSSDIYDSIIRIATGNDTNGGINTQVLSLCCYLLYNKNKNVQTTIRLNDIEELRGNLLGSFYDEATKDLTEIQRKVFEEHLVTENNRRLAWSKSAFFEAICNSKDNPQKESDFLNGEYAILRYVTTHGEKCVELIHDMLASIVAERKLHRKNRERNLRRRQNMMNVLSPEGRRLIDNALEFEPDVDKMEHDERYFLDEYMKYGFLLSNISEKKPVSVKGINTSNVSLQKVFDDSKLQDATIRLEFIDDNDEHVYTSDGIYIIDVKYTDNNITEILFFDSIETLTGSNVLSPVYIYGGFCGIRIEYKDGKESKRTYLQWDGEEYLPTITTGGYAIVEFLEFDKCGNPKKTVYKDIEGNPCRHREGNWGFLSEYDDDGFEKRRIFINEYNDVTPILSGIYARDLVYDSETGLLLKETNLDSNYAPARDKDGYCGAEFIRDIKGRLIEEKYIDEFGHLCLCKEGYAIQRIKYFDNLETKYSITSFYDISDNLVMHVDGYWMVRIEFDTFDYGSKMTLLDREQKSMCNKDGNLQELQVIYDKRHWLVGLRRFGKYGVYTQGFWLEYNSTYTHIARMGYLSADNKKMNYSGSSAYAIEAREDLNNLNLPLLRILLDERGLPLKLESGYYTWRTWEDKNEKWFDERNRTIRELYYDLDGNPMADIFGVYGKRYEYDDVLLIKNEISLDINGLDVNDINGICRIEMLFDLNGREICRKFYDKDGNRCLNSEGLLMFRFDWTDDSHIKTSIYYGKEERPSDKELGYAFLIEEMDSVFPSKVHRRYYKNAAQEIVVVDEGFYIAEYLYDKDGNIVEIRNIGSNGVLMNTQNGYAIYRVETINNDEGQIRKVSYMDESGSLVIPNGQSYAISQECYDEKGRMIKERIFGIKEEPIQFPDGTYGATYEYGADDNIIIQFNIDEEGQLMSDNTGIARRLVELDNKGQKLKEINYDLKGDAILTDDDDYGKKWRYSESVDGRIETEESLSEKESLKLNKWGYAIQEKSFDKMGHPVYVSYYDENSQPTECNDQYHVTHYEYNEEFTERVISYCDIDNNLCENRFGVSQVIQKLDSYDRVVFEYRLNQKGEKVPYDATTYFVKKDYISDNDWKEYYLNQEGELYEDSNGVAYLHLRKDDSGRIVYKMTYNSQGIPQADGWGDYGEETFYDDTQNMQKYIGLDCEGHPHENKLGFVSQIVFQINNVTIRIFLDGDDSPVSSIYGEFGQEVEQIDEFTTKTTSIDSDLNPMIPNNHGYASEIKTLDENGRTKRLFWLNPDGSSYVDSDGDSGVEFVYLEESKQITIFLNKQGNPHINNRGYAQRLVEFDESGNEKAIMWLDVDSKPIANVNGDYGIIVEHGDVPNSIIRAFLDKEGNPHKNSEGWTFRKEISLDDSNMEFHHYDIDMNPIEDQDGDVAYRRERDKEGAISFVSLDVNGNLHNNRRGFAKRVVVLDDKERIIKERWYKEDGTPFVDSNGDYGIETIFEDEQKARIQVFLDSDESPRLSVERPFCAIKTYKDELGRDVKLLYLDANLQSIKNSDGTYGKTTEYKEDSLFSFVETNIDAMGIPCENASGYVKKHIREDNSGRPILVAYTDAEDNILTDSLGDKASGFIYSSDRDIFIIDSLDADYNPHINNLGYSREIRIRVTQDEYKSVYLDLHGNTVQPRKRLNGLVRILGKLFNK